MKPSQSMLMLANMMIMTLTPTYSDYPSTDKHKPYSSSATPKQLNKRRKDKAKRRQGKKSTK